MDVRGEEDNEGDRGRKMLLLNPTVLEMLVTERGDSTHFVWLLWRCLYRASKRSAALFSVIYMAVTRMSGNDLLKTLDIIIKSAHSGLKLCK